MFNHTSGLLLQTVLYLVNKDTLNVTNSSNTIEEVRRGEDKELLCYGHLGCYSVNYPWTDESRPVSMYPEPPEKVNPGYCLYTRKNPRSCQRLYYNNPESITASYLIPSHRVYFIAHGFLDSGGKPWITLLARKLLIRHDCNVIAIDWGGGSSPPYAQAAANIRLVGTITAHLINTLNREVGVRTEYIHMIGHSLGAHLCGYAGNSLKTLFGLKLGRITGLDPAEPHFSQTDPVVRLDPTDAIFVDIIHTDTTPFIKGGLGMDEPIGHLDFYPNGGENQPGCDHSVRKFMDEEEGSFVKGLTRFLGCDHVRSHAYFSESVSTQCEYLAIECDSWETFKKGDCFKCRDELNRNGRVCAKMGYDADKAVKKEIAESGNIHPVANRSMVKLFSMTASKQPYCRSLYRVTLSISNSKDSIEHKGEIGEFSIELNGIKGVTDVIPLFSEMYFGPGTTYREVVSGKQVGRVRSAILHWKHHTTLNVLSWRLTRARIHFDKVRIDNLEEDASTVLCPVKDEVIYSGSPINLKTCGETGPIEE